MDKKHSTTMMVLACISFLALGIITAAIGPALPELADQTQSTLSQVGSLFTGLFFGALAAQVSMAVLLDRLGARLILVVSLVVLGVCLVGATIAPTLGWLLVFCALAGLGHGAVNVTVNVTISNAFPQRRATVLNLLNVFFGVGAILGPAVAGLTLRLWDTALPSLWLGAGLEVLFAPIFFMLVPKSQPQAAAETRLKPRRALFTSPVLWTLGAIVLIYVGIENGMGGWIPSYMEQTVAFNPANAALAAAAFWVALTGGRMLASYLGTRLKAMRLLQVSLLTALLGAAILVLGHGHALPTLAGILVLGLGFGPVYPTAMAITTAIFTSASGTAASFIAAFGSVGGMLIPWLQGVVLEGGTYAAILLTLGCTLLMLAGYAWLRNLQRRFIAQTTVKEKGRTA